VKQNKSIQKICLKIQVEIFKQFQEFFTMIGMHLRKYQRDEFQIILVNSLLSVKVNSIIEQLLSNQKTIVKII
jgi:hypothetical protein